MGVGGGDDDEEGESEDEDDDGEGTGLAGNRPESKRRKQCNFYFRTGAVIRTTSHNGRKVTTQCQVGGRPLSKGKTSFKLTCKSNRCPKTQTL